MSWNYRACHRPSVPGSGYQIHEIYYDDEGNIEFYTKNPISPHGDIVDELYADLTMMMDALDFAPIDLDELDKMFSKKDKDSA